MNSNKPKGIGLVLVLVIGLAAGILIGKQGTVSVGSGDPGKAAPEAKKEKEIS